MVVDDNRKYIVISFVEQNLNNKIPTMTKLTATELYHIMSWVFMISFGSLIILGIESALDLNNKDAINSFIYVLVMIYSLFESTKYYIAMKEDTK